MRLKNTFISLMDRRHLFLLFVSSISFLVLFQGRWAVSKSYGHDESCYLEYFHTFLNEPSWSCFSRDQMKGVSLMWLPVGVFVKIFSRIFNQPFTEWALPVIGLTSFVHWVLSLFILDKTFCLLAQRNNKTARWPAFWTVLIIFSIPVTTYVFRRNYLSHAAELLLVSLTFYSITTKRVIWTLVWSALVVATRLNNVLILLPLLAFVQPYLGYSALSPGKKKALLFASLISCAVCLTLFIRVAFFTGYSGYYLSHVLKAMQWKGVPTALFDHYHGLVWRNFVWLFLLGYLTLRFRKISNMGRAICLWLAGLFALYVSVTVFWGYAEQRFLIGSYIAGYWYILSIWEDVSKWIRKLFLVLVPFSAVWNLWIFAAWISPVLRSWGEQPGHHASSELVATVYLLLSPTLVFKALAGLSPIGFSTFSWFQHLDMFSRYATFSKYTVSGPPLWILTLACVAALVCLIFTSWRIFSGNRNDNVTH